MKRSMQNFGFVRQIDRMGHMINRLLRHDFEFFHTRRRSCLAAHESSCGPMRIYASYTLRKSYDDAILQDFGQIWQLSVQQFVFANDEDHPNHLRHHLVHHYSKMDRSVDVTHCESHWRSDTFGF